MKNVLAFENSANPLKKRVMRRIYAVWFLKSVAPLLAVEFILLSGVAIGVLTHISLRNIMINALNASSGVEDFLQFFIDNFFVKSIQSRLLVAVYGALIGFFIRDFASAFRRMRRALKEDMLAALLFVR
ncbi:MAG: hypothetical protein HYT42_00045 [Candidatus Sungbacteria bacterium]|nr:hypothetical protein [Candidatus Sungbacteria bacterium]